jgi:uncharacterized protein (TIGR03435 family)
MTGGFLSSKKLIDRKHRITCWPALVILACSLASGGHSEEDRPEFEVASVKPLAALDTRRLPVFKGGPGTADPTRFSCENSPIVLLIMGAFAVRDHWRISGPVWLDTSGIEVAAKVPPGATPEQFQAMLRNLLTDRFHLKAHWETRQSTVSTLVPAKGGSKLKTAAASGKEPCDDIKKHDSDSGCALLSYSNGRFTYNGRAPIEALVGALRFHLSRPVTDATGLKGEFDFRLSFVKDGSTEAEFGVSIEKALRDQAGLQLENRKGPVEFLVVDHMDGAPSAN